MTLLDTLLYRTFRATGRFIFFCTMNVRIHRPAALRTRGPYVLAVTHMSHLEPFIASIVVRPDIDWITRVEFFRKPLYRFLLDHIWCIRVKRQGVPVQTMRTSAARLKAGRIIGIFPEGGVSRGKASVCNGGPIRDGACPIAARAQVPIVPCVILGAHELLKVGPWLPAKRGHLWIGFGEPLQPPTDIGRTVAERRQTYRRFGERLQQAYRDLYQDMLKTYGLSDQAGDTWAEAHTAAAATQSGASASQPPTALVG